MELKPSSFPGDSISNDDTFFHDPLINMMVLVFYFIFCCFFEAIFEGSTVSMVHTRETALPQSLLIYECNGPLPMHAKIGYHQLTYKDGIEELKAQIV